MLRGELVARVQISPEEEVVRLRASLPVLFNEALRRLNHRHFAFNAEADVGAKPEEVPTTD